MHRELRGARARLPMRFIGLEHFAHMICTGLCRPAAGELSFFAQDMLCVEECQPSNACTKLRRALAAGDCHP